MGYYMRGDYYTRGDYYRRGDFFGGLIGGIAGAVKGFATGGLTGAFTGAIGGANVGSRGAPKPPGTGIMGPVGRGALVGGALFGPVGAAAGALGGYAGSSEFGGCIPRGYHQIKHGPHAGNLTKNRHMNPLNVRALRRADRRARSFLHITRSVTKHYVAKQPKGRAYVRATKRRSR